MTAVFIVGIVFAGLVLSLAVIGGTILMGIKLKTGGISKTDRHERAEEARMIQEIYKGLSQMDARIDWPVVILYVIAAMVMKPGPIRPLETDDERYFYDDYVHSRHNAARRIKRRYDQLDRRLRRMEDRVTAKEFDWDRRMGAQ